MRNVKVLQVIVVAALLVALMAGIGCGSTGSQGAETPTVPGSPASPSLTTMGPPFGHIIWQLDAQTGYYVISEGYPLTAGGSGFPPNEVLYIYLDVAFPDVIVLGNVTTNAAGAFYAVFSMHERKIAPARDLDTTWVCQPPLCPQSITRMWRACELQAVIDNRIVATCPMVAHESWSQSTGNSTAGNA